MKKISWFLLSDLSSIRKASVYAMYKLLLCYIQIEEDVFQGGTQRYQTKVNTNLLLAVCRILWLFYRNTAQSVRGVPFLRLC